MRFVRNTSATNLDEIKTRVRCRIASAETKTEKQTQKSFWLDKILYLKRKTQKLCKKIDRRILTPFGAVLSAMAIVLIFNANFSFGYNVFMSGEDLGFAPSKAYVKNCIASVNNEFSRFVSGEDIIDGKVAYVPTVVRKDSFTDELSFLENIKATSDIMVKAYAVEVDGMAYVALENENHAKSILDAIANYYKADESTEVSFEEDVELVYEYVPSSMVFSVDQAMKHLMGSTVVYKKEKANCNMMLKDFALAAGLSEKEIKELNDNVGKYISPLDEIVVPHRKSIITVLTNDTLTYDMSLPFEEKIVKDNELYEGTKRVKQIGQNGVAEVTERVVRSNGNIVSKTVVDSQIKSEPVMQMVSVGTKERPSNVGTGNFVRPYYGTISSRFGARSRGNHTGVDFCGSEGDPIIAADNGTVIFSGWSGGYGYVVKIDHNNGYTTYYAHCSKLYVKEGDTVKKGETIAAVGSTGNSTGPHVHFEVRYNDEIHNPMNYVG